MPDTTSELFPRTEKLGERKETPESGGSLHPFTGSCWNCWRKGLSAPEWMTAADASKSYGYQICGGTVPGRDICCAPPQPWACR